MIKSLGFVPYKTALSKMEEHVLNKNSNEIWFMEHESIYTKGTSAKDSDLLNPLFPVIETGRGGQFTYHGPGQLIVYVMIHLKELNIRAYVSALEDVILHVLKQFDIQGFLYKDRVGVWIQHMGVQQKIAAIGIRITKGITWHGFAFNVNPNLSHYCGIIPCGLKDYGVTSLQALGIETNLYHVQSLFQEAFNQSEFFKAILIN